jgi:hypothetical protein
MKLCRYCEVKLKAVKQVTSQRSVDDQHLVKAAGMLATNVALCTVTGE